MEGIDVGDLVPSSMISLFGGSSWFALEPGVGALGCELGTLMGEMRMVLY